MSPLQQPTEEAVSLLREVAASWAAEGAQFVVLSYADKTRAQDLQHTLASWCAFAQQEGAPVVGYCVVKARRGPYGKAAFMGVHGCHVLVDDDRKTGEEAELAGARFFEAERGKKGWLYRLHHFAATTAGSFVRERHCARVLQPGEWYRDR